jgi:hypothetical protein
MRCVDNGRNATRATFLSQSTCQGSGNHWRAVAFPARPRLVRQVDPPPEVRVPRLRPDLDGSDQGRASAVSARRSSLRSQRGQSASDAQLVICSSFMLCYVSANLCDDDDTPVVLFVAEGGGAHQRK